MRAITSIDISQNGDRLVSAGEDSIMVSWDVKTGRELSDRIIDCSSITKVRFLPNGEIITASFNGDILFLQQGSLNLRKRITTSYGSGFGFTLSKDGQILFIEQKAHFEIHFLENNNLLRIEKPESEDDYFYCAAFSSDAKLIAVGSGTGLFDTGVGVVYVWEVDSGKRVAVLKDLPGGVLDVAFSQNNEEILVAGENGLLCIIDIETQEICKDFPCGNKTILCASFSNNYDKIVSGSDDFLVELWDVKSTQRISFSKGESIISDVRFCSNDTILVANYFINTSVLFDESLTRPIMFYGRRDKPKRHTVPDDYSTIQQAINSSKFGDEVFIRIGEYHERLIMKDGIILSGETIVQKNTYDDERLYSTILCMDANQEPIMRASAIRKGIIKWITFKHQSPSSVNTEPADCAVYLKNCQLQLVHCAIKGHLKRPILLSNDDCSVISSCWIETDQEYGVFRGDHPETDRIIDIRLTSLSKKNGLSKEEIDALLGTEN